MEYVRALDCTLFSRLREMAAIDPFSTKTPSKHLFLGVGRGMVRARIFVLTVLCLCWSLSVQASTANARTANIETQSLGALAETSSIQSRLQPVVVMSSIWPLHLILEALIPQESQKFWQLEVLVPPQGSHHGYQLLPSDVSRLNKVATVFWLGSAADPQLNKAIARFSVPNIPLSDALITWRQLDPKDLELIDDHSGHQYHGVDPHIWLSFTQLPAIFTYASSELKVVLQRSARVFGWTPAQLQREEQLFDAQLQLLLSQHKALLKKIYSLAGTWPYRDYISFHDAFGYLDDAIKIRSLGSFVRNPEDGIAPRQLVRLQEVMEDETLGCVFLEPAADGRKIQSFIPETIPIVDLDILATSLPDGVGLWGFWEYLLEQFQSCFGRSEIPESVEPYARPVEKKLRPLPKEEERILDKLMKW